MATIINRCPNPSFELNATGVTAVPGTGGTAAVSNPAVASGFRSKVARTTWSVASTAAGGGQYIEVDLATQGLVVDDVVSLGVFWLQSSIANRLALSAEWRTNVGTISTVTGTAKQVAAGTAQTAADKLAASLDASWKLQNLTIPATATKLRIALRSTSGTGYANWSIGSNLAFDGIMLNKGAVLADYVDGALGGFYAWAGVADASQSVQYLPALAVTALAATATLPERADITVTDGPPAAATITVLAVADVTYTVRDATRALVSGGFFVTDYEIPLGIPVLYRAEYFNASGVSLGISDGTQVQIDTDPAVIVVQDPLAPRQFVHVDVPPVFAGMVGRRRAMSKYQVGGKTVALMGELGLRSGVPMSMNTRTLDQADMLEAILAQAPFLIRTMPNIVRLPALFYGVTDSPEQIPVDLAFGEGGQWIRWDVKAEEVSPLELNIIEAVVTYARFKAVYATYAAAKAVYTTYLQAKQSPPPEL